jgi:hypothetical protein
VSKVSPAVGLFFFYFLFFSLVASWGRGGERHGICYARGIINPSTIELGCRRSEGRTSARVCLFWLDGGRGEGWIGAAAAAGDSAEWGS